MKTLRDIIPVLEEMAAICNDYALHKSKLEHDKDECLLLAKRYVGYSKTQEKKLSSLKLSGVDRQHFSILRDAAKYMTKFFVNESKDKKVAAYTTGLMVQNKIAEYRRRKNI